MPQTDNNSNNTRPNLPHRHTAPAEPYPTMPSHASAMTGWSIYPGHSSSSAPPGQPISNMTPTSGPPLAPKRGRPKAPPRPTPPLRPIPIAPAPASRPGPGPSSTRPHHGSGVVPTPVTRGGGFYHGPTNLPPEPYGAHQPVHQPRHGMRYPSSQGQSNISESQSQRLPELEARLQRLESAFGKYVDQRGERALERSNLPGSSFK